ncbi:GntR family transcriptional regulator (plasmid) [Alloyangia pacifica]|uniref:GntR family transcriptional regulator n=1 Tax=Alloyangia pacifica TaxID=311180 RepID=A0A2U8HJD6_9RHOB|nr:MULTISPECIES: GntR family transcriptional regulator [Roseobacteraceae]AWI85923.1 GntR family transcriptional regulator [Alloyangia pacifica]NDV52254.1 GntR family transcriptional regulator [Salipiger sp. PrR003]NDW31876.1 GntR family transcriptional regulator [Salipiger sp. PrR007]
MTLRDQAYETFTEQLLSRQISMGQFVSQRELVKITGMPLGAIREMIPRLEADGLIRTVPNRGLQIVQVDVGLIRNAFQLRAVLEREAVRNFAAVATDDELQDLQRRHLDIREAALQGVNPQLLAAAQQMDWDMHDRMIDALGNDIISAIYRTNSIKIRLIRNEDTRMLPELVVSVMDEHLALIDALIARDAASAEAALAAHLGSAKQRAVRI